MDNANRPKKKIKEYIPDQSIRFSNQFAWGGYQKTLGFFGARRKSSNAVSVVHRHPFIQLWFCARGVYRHSFLNADFELGRGSMVIVPPYFPHMVDSRNDVDLICCDIQKDFIMDSSDSEDISNALINLIFLEPVLINAKKISPVHYFSEEITAEIETLLSEACYEYEKKDLFSALVIRSNLSRVFAIIAKEYNLCGQDKRIEVYREALDRALKFMHEHFSEKLYLEDICKIAMINRQTFTYLFKQLMGMTVSKYLQYLRVFHAKELLANTNRTQQDISSDCGFQATPFFQKVFKEFTGMLPGQFRSSETNK